MILLTGASGFFGKIAFRVFASHVHTKGLCRSNTCGRRFTPIELTDASQVIAELDKLRPDVVVHAAACRDPDACEQRPEYAERLHVDATATVGEWCARNDATLVYISTDYVFDGSHPPYGEDDPTSAISVYGQTKAAGESAARTASKHIIVRLPLQYGFSQPDDDSFILKVLGAIEPGMPVQVDDYQFRYPTLSDDVALAILALVQAEFRGTIHLRGPTRTTRCEMWRTIAEAFELQDARIHPAPRPQEHTAPRPPDSRLSTRLYDSMALHQFRSFEDGLRFSRQLMEDAGYDWRANEHSLYI